MYTFIQKEQGAGGTVFSCTSEVASVSRIDTIIGLFCKRALQKRKYFAKEQGAGSGSALGCTLRLAAFMRWLRLLGSIELKVSFAKEPYKIDNILQKRLII